MQTNEKTAKNEGFTSNGMIASVRRSKFGAKRKAKLELAKIAKKKKLNATPNRVDYQPTGGAGLLYNPTVR